MSGLAGGDPKATGRAAIHRLPHPVAGDTPIAVLKAEAADAARDVVAHRRERRRARPSTGGAGPSSLPASTSSDDAVNDSAAEGAGRGRRAFDDDDDDAFFSTLCQDTIGYRDVIELLAAVKARTQTAY